MDVEKDQDELNIMVKNNDHTIITVLDEITDSSKNMQTIAEQIVIKGKTNKKIWKNQEMISTNSKTI